MSRTETDNPLSSVAAANDHLFQRGDRIVITGVRTEHIRSMNGRHGHVVAVGSHSCAIHLDAGNGKSHFQTVLITPTNLERESTTGIPLSCTIQNRAFVNNGVLVSGNTVSDGHSSKYSSAAMVGMMNLVRWFAANSCHADIQNQLDPVQNMSDSNSGKVTLSQIQRLSSNTANKLNEMAVKNWECIEESENNHGVYEQCIQYMDSEDIRSGFVIDALKDVRAIRSWNLGIQHEFWFVGRDVEGTYIVPDYKSHDHVVYKVVGISGPTSSSPQQEDGNATKTIAPVRLIRIPMRLRITILPWYGRIIYDTSVQPPSAESVMMATNPAQAHRLHSVVLHSIQAGTVIEHFAELEK
jgi:hypothetical protein